MDEHNATDDPDSERFETANVDLVNDIVSSLRRLKDSDTELTDILAEHLLTTSPALDAVEKSADAIAHLAVLRAKESGK